VKEEKMRMPRLSKMRAMAQRTLIISDTHFGDTVKTAGPVERFSSLVQQTDHLIINGDGFEFEPLKAKLSADQSLADLRALCLKNSAQLTTISGNHDPDDAWPRHFFLASNRVLLSHGESFHPGISPWCSVAEPLARAYAKAIADLNARGMPDTLETRLLAAHTANKAEWRREEDNHGNSAKRTTIFALAMAPHKIIRLLNYWRTIPSLASQFAHRYAPEAKVVLFGHTHHEGVWFRHGRWVVNTGAYRFPGRPLAVTLHDNILQVHRLKLINNQYTRSLKPLLNLNLDNL
jgi:predicted phosphodiesterase